MSDPVSNPFADMMAMGQEWAKAVNVGTFYAQGV